MKDVDFPITTDFIEVREIRGSRQAYSNFDGPVRPDASFTTSFYPAGGMGVVLRGLFGSVASALEGASTTAYTHVFGDAASLPSMSFERSDAQGAGQGLILQRLPGVKIESVGFTCSYGEDVEVSVNAQGIAFPETPGTKPATFTYPAMDPFIFTGASILIDGVANNLFKSIDFEFTNTLERQETLRGTREAYRIFEGGLACTLTGTLAFEDLALYTKLQQSDYLTVEAQFQGAEIDAANSINYGATFLWPKVKVSSFGIPMTAGEVMEADVEFQVSFDQATSELVHVTLTNLDAANTYDT